jgi:menaquinol-cytochrome c reductase iron-sulfur subunit
MHRRAFYVSVIYGLWSLVTAALAVPAGVYLLLPPRIKKEEDWVEATDFARLKLNVPEEIVFRRNRKDGWKITSEKATAWMLRTSETELVAFAPQCTHLGCAYHWDDRNRNFLCPCHTSTFGLDGSVLSGPAPRPLDRYKVAVRGDKVFVGPVA